jgi:hypothetical protein
MNGAHHDEGGNIANTTVVDRSPAQISRIQYSVKILYRMKMSQLNLECTFHEARTEGVESSTLCLPSTASKSCNEKDIFAALWTMSIFYPVEDSKEVKG